MAGLTFTALQVLTVAAQTGMPPMMGAPGKKGKMGNYGGGQKNRKKHVNCLRRLLDQHGPHLVGQGLKDRRM